ncbi:fibronectin type III domain-containing protein [Fodinibius sp. SL11]|uniref:fibronectin type III domain-containing protein n=1 Tax=Fodinibius sp. SL11 TaxID=3425690 RepID=UPI003F881DF3
MNRIFLIPSIVITLCGFLVLTSCGGSSTSPDDTDNNAPSAPTSLKGTSGDQEVVLTWDANTESDLTGYNLYRSTSSISDISGMDPVNGSNMIQAAEYTDTALENGTTYYYRLTAIDENENESSMSSQLEITPFSNPPDRP